MRDRLAMLTLLAAVHGCGGPGEPPTTVALADSADQVLWGVATTVSIDGIPRIKLEADTVYVYQGTQVMEMLGVKVEFYSPSGALSSTVTSREGTYMIRTGDMEARGDVVGESPDRRRLTTTILRYQRATHRISGPEAFVFDSPTEHLEGSSFTSDPDLTNMSATNPRRGRATTVRIPG
jgi:LPS export ABC transporter protein LptC